MVLKYRQRSIAEKQVDLEELGQDVDKNMGSKKFQETDWESMNYYRTS